MASKDTAVFLVPNVIHYLVLENLLLPCFCGESKIVRFIRKKASGLLLYVVAGWLVLTPFANPISLAQEILRPVTNQEFDVRGGNIESYTVKAMVSGRAVRPEVSLVKRISGFNASLVWILLALPLLAIGISTALGRMAFIFLLLSFPYRLLFGASLSYRFLMFTPFFAILAALVLKRKHLVAIAVFLIVVDVILAIDPLTTGIGSKYDVTMRESLLEALRNAFR
jgi:hypothetical protein